VRRDRQDGDATNARERRRLYSLLHQLHVLTRVITNGVCLVFAYSSFRRGIFREAHHAFVATRAQDAAAKVPGFIVSPNGRLELHQ
jgi:hypothetical protein